MKKFELRLVVILMLFCTFSVVTVCGEEILPSKIESTSRIIKEQQDDFDPTTYTNSAEIIILNKITAKATKEKLNLNEVKYFGNLSIEVKKCLKNTDLLNPNNMILVSIYDNKIDEDNILIFQGWLISANPSISTFEHPVYEIIALNCL